MRTILVPVDASACSNRAVEEAIKIARQSGPVDLHLLNVQPRIFSEQSLIFLDTDKIDTYYFEQGERALESAERLLREANLPFTSHRAVGPIAETIVAKAGELSADAILMGTHGHGRVAGMLLGSVSNKVLHLSPVPVMLVREQPPVDFTGRLSAT